MTAYNAKQVLSTPASRASFKIYVLLKLLHIAGSREGKGIAEVFPVDFCSQRLIIREICILCVWRWTCR